MKKSRKAILERYEQIEAGKPHSCLFCHPDGCLLPKVVKEAHNILLDYYVPTDSKESVGGF